MSITRKDIEHIARLARLALSEEEKEKFIRDVGSILGYIAKLNEVDTKKVNLNLVEQRAVNQWRADESEESGMQEEILKLAPAKRGRNFEVKGVFEE